MFTIKLVQTAAPHLDRHRAHVRIEQAKSVEVNDAAVGKSVNFVDLYGEEQRLEVGGSPLCEFQEAYIMNINGKTVESIS